MPFSIDISGMDELIKAFDQAPKKAKKAAKVALHDGAGIVADALTREIDAIKTEPFKYAKDGKRRNPSPEEKAIVQGASHGVAKFRESGDNVNTSVGFQKAGYASIPWNHAKSGKRTKYKNASGNSVKPVEVIVNSINHGTSFMNKQPFARKAFKQNEAKATKVIEEVLTKELEKLDIE